MKKSLLPFVLVSTIFAASCKKAEMPADSLTSRSTSASQPASRYVILSPGEGNKEVVLGRQDPGDCTPTEVTLIAGQTINAGTVAVYNDAEFIYVTYTTTGGWVIAQTHLYVGDCTLIPVNNPGNPMPGQFPYAGTHNNVTSVTYQVPISRIPGGNCGCIAAHAVVKKYNSSNQLTDTQTGWGNGTRINLTGGNWGMKFDYCSCTPL